MRCWKLSKPGHIAAEMSLEDGPADPALSSTTKTEAAGINEAFRLSLQALPLDSNSRF
jgi:hypothetical protein